MNFLTQIISVVGGGLNSVLGLVASTMQAGFKSAIQFHKEGIAFARDAGLSAKQAQAYTNALIERTEVLANRYGVSADAIKEVQRNLSEATGKQLLLNDAQTEGFVQIDKMMGAQARSKFTEEIMNGMGGQIDTVQGAMAKVYATATKQGLNAKKLTDKVAQNLSMANRLSFRNGIDGITKMAALSEKVGLNMASVESAAKNFLEIDKSIQTAAQMQMLGGSAAASFGNPLTAMYEANYDPEAFAKRLSDSLASYATFDKSKGIANVNGMNMNFVREIAKAMGISEEDAVKNAKKQAEVRYKETALGGTLDRVARGDEAKRNYILNNAQVTNNGRDLEINGRNINTISDKEWADMMHFEGMSDKEILEEQARTLTSIDKQISGAASSVAASFARGIDEYFPDLRNQVQSIGDFFKIYAEQWGKDTGQVVGKAMTWVNAHGDEIATVVGGILNGITKIFSFFANHWQGLIAAIAAWKVGNTLLGGTSLGGNTVGGRAAKNILSTSRDMNIATRLGYAESRNLGNGRIMSAIKAPFKGFGALSGAQKAAVGGTAALGGALAIGQGAMALMSYKHQKEELSQRLASGEISKEDYNNQIANAKTERNESVGGSIGMGVGTAIGTALGGPIGAAIGGLIGQYGGQFIGKHWEDIKGFAKSAWDSTKEFASGVWGGIKDLAKGAWNLVPEDARTAITNGFKTIAPIAKGAWNFIKGYGLGAFTVIKGAALGTWDVIKGGALGVWNAIKGTALGVWEIIKGTWNGLWDIISAPFQAIGDVVDGVKEGVGQIFNGNIVDGIMTIFGGIGKGLFDVVSAPFKAIYHVGEGVFKGIGEYIKGIWSGIGEFVKGIWGGISKVANGVWRGLLTILSHIPVIGKYIEVPEEEKHAEGGVIGGSSYNGDRVLARLNSGEMVLNQNQQSNAYNHYFNTTNAVSSINASQQGDLFKAFNTSKGVSSLMPSTITSVLSNNNDVMAKPVGEKEYIYTPTRSETSNINGNTVTVKDFNINLSGTIKLDGGNNSKNVDVNALLNDYQFINNLKEMIKTSINNDMNGGRYMNDLATMRGHTTSSSIIR